MNKRSTAISAVLALVASMTSCDPAKIPSATLPIMAWYSIPAEDATLERYQELADCGFNINFSHLYSLEDLKTALDLSQQVGVKVMATCTALESATDSAVALVKDHPALYGYFLRDEPACPGFPYLAEWAQKIKAADDSHMLYLNLLPNYAPLEMLGASSYREYVKRFIDEVKLPLVSFDFYPITTEGIRQMWYANLQDVADESTAAGLPFWAFALSTAHDPYPEPTMASLRIQMYTNLAYGAQGLQYFTYWNPGTEIWNFHEAPINQDKKRSQAYDLVKAMNEELQARAGIFVGAKLVSLAHTGETVPPECKRLEELPEHVTMLDTGADGAVVSVLENGGVKYLVCVNRSLDKPFELKVAFDTKAFMIDRDGKAVKVAKGENTYTVEEGDVAIFQLKK